MTNARFPLEGLGLALRAARIEQHIALDHLASDLHWGIPQLEALEQDDWDSIPPGQERAMARQVADRLGFDLEAWATGQEDWEAPLEDPAHPPSRPVLERAMSVLLAIASLTALAWLVIPGKDLKQDRTPKLQPTLLRKVGYVPFQVPRQPFPVLGEAIPEAPITQEGALITLRTTDLCQITVTWEGGQKQQVVQTGEPWRFRVRGSFQIALDNAGVAALDVAGKPVRHGGAVGESWQGGFDAQGGWLQAPAPRPAKAPAEPPEPDSEEET